MTKKEKTIGITCFTAGVISGTAIGYWIADLTITRTIFFMIALVAIGILGLLTWATICEVRAEERQKAQRSYPANWHYDRHLEN